MGVQGFSGPIREGPGGRMRLLPTWQGLTAWCKKKKAADRSQRRLAKCSDEQKRDHEAHDDEQRDIH